MLLLLLMKHFVMACGFLILNKIANYTSHQCVTQVRQAYHLKRVGHGGTLDPDVTGVLTIAIGSATRLLPYLPSKKSYLGEIQLGQITTTDDLRGEIVSNAMVPKLDLSQIQKILSSFLGVSEQQPPQISAIHINGERAYMRARRGENIIMPIKEITIDCLELEHWEQITGRLRLRISCSSGTYVRSLSRDLGIALGCGGCLAWLQRTEAQGFQLDIAVPIKALTGNSLPKLLTPIEAIKHLNSYKLTEDEYYSWECGRAFPFLYDHSILQKSYAHAKETRINIQTGVPFSIIAPNGEMAGIGFAKDNVIQPKVVLKPKQ
uniref:tRNA pseudouridine(55) synthase n=1 Tax=Paulinella longichromatophora TaxID=1708747 RepID=A0A2H4ZQJ1_9EUKA|nr:putative tRNA pseudouridine 55 synthase [Paulinella longichromatophora]